MAESIVNFILGKLADATVQELLQLCGVDEKVKLVSDELGWIQAFLKDADRKNISGDELQRHWVKQIREVAYDIEDVIDNACLLGIEMESPHKKHNMMGAVKRMFKSPKNIPALRELGVEIDQILKRIKTISESRENYGTKNLGEGSGDQTELPVGRLLVPDLDDPNVVGFEQHIDNIKKELLDDSTKRLCVISIVGPGGLGKTTLARKVYNSQDVKTGFDLCIWTTVSQTFKLADILRSLLEAVRRGIPVDANEQGQPAKYYHEKLYKSLLEKRYLVVLDDIWENNNPWVQIEEAFPDIKNGSRVLMTTRFDDVAKSADCTREPYTLSYLPEEPSIALLLKKALPRQDPAKDYPKNLSALAKEFSKKCGGLPLALVVLGGLLSKQPPNEHAWRKVMQKMNWRADASKVLATSYEDLPFALKSCFMYFALFPEDYQIDVRDLIRMWIAEGFIPHDDNGGLTLEDIALNYFEDLVQRNMVRPILNAGPNGSFIGGCYIHDLLHDIAIRKAEEDNFLIVSSNPDDQKNCRGARRLAFHHDKCDELLKDANPNLRSLFCFKGIPNVSRHRHLKVLSDMGERWEFHAEKDGYEIVLPSLRYVKLSSDNYIREFRKIKNMRFLHTLDIRNSFVMNIPDSMWHIKTLRHVLLSANICGDGPPPLIEMRNLQTLGGVIPRSSWEDQGLPILPSLRELHLDKPKAFPCEVLLTFIGSLRHLEILTMAVSVDEDKNPIREKFEQVSFLMDMFYN